MKKVVLASILTMLPLVCFAETIVLKSGKSVKGEIIESSDQYVKIDLEGVMITYYTDEIERVEKQPAGETASLETQAKETTPTPISHSLASHYKDADLFKAAANGDQQKIMQILSDGVDVNSQNNNDKASALMMAVIGGRKEAAKLLLSKGANINAQEATGTTALIFAVALNSKEMVKLLLAYNPDMSLKDHAGYTALMTAEEPGADQDLEIIQLLKEHLGK